MEEVEIPVSIVLVYGIHCGCGGRISSCDGPALTSYPPQNLHRCDKCGGEMYVIGKQYPIQKFVEVPDGK